MKYSKQRELTLNAVRENIIHPTADDVYAILKPENPSISLGTVYRNLNVLVGNGMINKLKMPSGSDRYDGDLKNHYHVVCDKCGKIYDIGFSVVDELDTKIKSITGVTVTWHQLIIVGICEACREENLLDEEA